MIRRNGIMILKDIVLTTRSITKLVKMMDFRFIFVMLKMNRYFWQNNGVHFIWIILYYYILNCTYLYKLEILRINKFILSYLFCHRFTKTYT